MQQPASIRVQSFNMCSDINLLQVSYFHLLSSDSQYATLKLYIKIQFS